MQQSQFDDDLIYRASLRCTYAPGEIFKEGNKSPKNGLFDSYRARYQLLKWKKSWTLNNRLSTCLDAK